MMDMEQGIFYEKKIIQFGTDIQWDTVDEWSCTIYVKVDVM